MCTSKGFIEPTKKNFNRMFLGIVIVLLGGVYLIEGLHYFSGSIGSFPRIAFHSHTIPSSILINILQPFFIT